MRAWISIGFSLLFLSQGSVFDSTRLDPDSLTSLPVPYGLLQGGVAVLDASIGSRATLDDVRIVDGSLELGSYLAAGVGAWRFETVRQVESRAQRLSVTALFRPSTMFPIGDAARELRTQGSGPGDSPPLPRRVVDPGYPPASVAEGAVVIEVEILASARIGGVRVVGDVPSLTESALRAVRQWEFTPARQDGRAVDGVAIAVISFRRP